ncbi:MAG: CxxC motif-containing protein (DUF1111 family) [Bacteroidia bacterium]|jgi:CxxC motif-containing protein (DUF1111 family)
MNKLIISLTVAAAVVVLASCDKTVPDAPDENSLLDGPIEGLSTQDQAAFLRGDEAFAEVFTISKGLGPVFIASQCSSCHPGDGKGNPFVGFLRFGQPDTLGNQYLNQGGPQLQHKAIPGFEPEALPFGATSTLLIAPAVTGLGYLDAVSDADLIALADPTDADGDGISGRPHWNNKPDYTEDRPHTVTQNGQYITRFGKKGGAYDLLHQTSGAYNQDMGITSQFEPIDPHTGLEVDPEVSNQVVNDVVAYLKTLKAPLRRNEDAPSVMAGEAIFSQVACNKCHTPTMESGESSISVLSNQTFHPYTDMLLHDMGAGLDDGYTEGFALTSEWRTPPLWGLGLSKDAQGGSYFLLHDGRATSIEQAIEMHGGEAEASKLLYSQLSSNEKDQLMNFLESL